MKKMGQNYLIPVHYFVMEIITNISIGTCKYDMYNCLPLERCKELPHNEFLSYIVMAEQQRNYEK